MGDRLNGFPQFTAILFDLDGTLRDNQPTGHEAFWQHAESLGVISDIESRRNSQRWAFKYWAESDLLLGDIEMFGETRGNPAFWENYALRYLEAMGCKPETAQELGPKISAYMHDHYQPEDVILPGVIPALESLKVAGTKLGVVTNRTDPVGGYLEEIGLCAYFAFSLAGGEVEARKPYPQIFEAALERIGSAPEETIYVGDNYYADVVGARNAGLHPILVDPLEVFPDADCPVVRHLGELQTILFPESVN